MVRHGMPSYGRKRQRVESSTPTAPASFSRVPVPQSPSPTSRPIRVNVALAASATLQEAPAVSLYEALSQHFPPEPSLDESRDDALDVVDDDDEREGIGRGCDAYLEALHERVKNTLRKDPEFLRKRRSTRFPPPDPVLERDRDRAKLYYMPELVYFLPFDLDDAFSPNCVFCDTDDVENNGWSRVRRVVGLSCSYFVTTRRYKCKGCNKTFLGWDDKILDRAPPYIVDTFPAIFTRRLAVDKHLFRLYRAALKSGSTPYRFAKMIRSLHAAEHQRRQVCYFALAKADTERFGAPMPAWPKDDPNGEDPTQADRENGSAAQGDVNNESNAPGTVNNRVESQREQRKQRRMAEQAAPRIATKIAPAPSPPPASFVVAPPPSVSRPPPASPTVPPKLLPAPPVGPPIPQIGNMPVAGAIVPVPGGFFVPRLVPDTPFREYVPMRKARKTRTCVTCKASSCPGSQRRQNCVELRRKQPEKTSGST